MVKSMRYKETTETFRPSPLSSPVVAQLGSSVAVRVRSAKTCYASRSRYRKWPPYRCLNTLYMNAPQCEACPIVARIVWKSMSKDGIHNMQAEDACHLLRQHGNTRREPSNNGKRGTFFHGKHVGLTDRHVSLTKSSEMPSIVVCPEPVFLLPYGGYSNKGRALLCRHISD